jgi:hypothetical protein
MPNYFDIKRDNELIAAGTHFWCQTCLMARPLDDQSPDPRYCQGCYDFLCKEAEMLPPKRGRPQWVPKAQGLVPKLPSVSEHTPQIMSTVKRGPKHKALPVKLITQWASEGMGSKAIAVRLKGEGVEISYKTIQRLLSGQRVLV